MSKVTVIGLGGMGSALATSLLQSGFRVTVWNRTASRATPLVAAGAIQADSVSEAIKASTCIVSCINSHSDTQELINGCAGEISGKHFIELTTGSAEEAKTLEQLIHDNQADCVSGRFLPIRRVLANRTP